MSAPAVEIRDLGKAYPARGWLGAWAGGGRVALDKADLTVDAGEGVALVGPNGAGKSTLLLLLSGLRRPTEGTVRVFGHDPADPRNRARIGLLPDRPALSPELTAEDHLLAVAAAYQIPDADVRIAEVMGRVDLRAAGEGPVGTLSAGTQKRLSLALALLPAPELLLLDEPLGALDPDSARVVLAALSEERGRGCTIVVATHRLTDLAPVCDRVVKVQERSVQRLGTVEALLVRLPVRVIYTLPPGAREPTVGSVEPSPPGIGIRVAPANRRDALVEQVRTAGGAVLRLSPMLDLLMEATADHEETLA